jgi:hypothetical protein
VDLTLGCSAFLREGLTTAGDKPVVAVNEHSSIPHYAPSADYSAAIREGISSFSMFEQKRIRRTVFFTTLHGSGVSGAAIRTATGNLRSCRRRSRPRRRNRTFRYFFGTEDLWGGKSTVLFVPSSPPEGTANISFTGLDTRLVPAFMRMEPTWTIWRLETNGRSSPTFVSPWNWEFTCQNSALEAKSRYLCGGTAEVTGRIQTELVVI